MSNCKICGRELDTSDPTTQDCGGDCLKCMAEAGDPDCIKSMELLEHTHCWGGPDSTCEAMPEHLVCCVCGIPHPSINASIKSAVSREKKVHELHISLICDTLHHGGMHELANSIEEGKNKLLNNQK